MINLKEIKYIWIGLGLLSILFHIYLIFSGLVPSLISRPLHMALAIPWVFIFISQNKSQLFLGYNPEQQTLFKVCIVFSS